MQLIPEAQEILNGIKNGTLQINDVIDKVYNNSDLKVYLKLFKKALFPNYYNSDFNMREFIILPLKELCYDENDTTEDKIKKFCNFIEKDDYNRIYREHDHDNDEDYEYTFLSSLISSYSNLMPMFHFIHESLHLVKDDIFDITIDCILNKLRLNMVHDRDTGLLYRDAQDDAECIGYLYHLDVLDDYLKKDKKIDNVLAVGNSCVQLAVIEWSSIDINKLDIGFCPVVAYSYKKNNKTYEIHYP